MNNKYEKMILQINYFGQNDIIVTSGFEIGSENEENLDYFDDSVPGNNG